MSSSLIIALAVFLFLSINHAVAVVSHQHQTRFNIRRPLWASAGANSNDATRQQAVQTLTTATLEKSIATDDVKTAINVLESLDATTVTKELQGKWELVYSSLIPSGYFPVQEVADFFGYSLTSRFGPLPLGGFYGDWEITSETNPCVIRFTTTEYRLGPVKLKLKGKERSYTFLYADKDIAVARSSTGGGTLLKRISSSPSSSSSSPPAV